jgi:uridine kinase
MPIQLKYIHPDAIDLDSTFKQCLTELLQRVEVKPKESIAQQAIEEPKSTPSKKKILVRGTRL